MTATDRVLSGRARKGSSKVSNRPSEMTPFKSTTIRLSVTCSTLVLTIATGTAFGMGGGWGGGWGGGGGGGGGPPPDFILDFQPDPSGDRRFTEGVYNSGGGWSGGGGWGNGDSTTDFLQENVTGSYIHQIIGTPESGFVQEVYIEATQTLSFTFSNPTASGNTGMNNPFGAGTGTGNPNKVIMRQLVTDNESANEFLKDVWLAKPVITSGVNDGEMVINTTIDMNEISYQDGITPAQMALTIQFIDPLLDPEFRPEDFDLATDTEYSTIVAGRYIYNEGSGPLGSVGTYSYTDGAGFNLDGVNWASFCDPSQNETTPDGWGGWGGNGDYCEGGNSAGGSDGGGWGGGGWGGW